MRLKNTSKYPDDEVRHLVEFSMSGIRTARLQVNVKNARCAYRGRAYEGVPYMSPASSKATVDRLVTIGIGPESRFPCDNISTYPDGPWRDDYPPDDLDRALLRSRVTYRGGVRKAQWQRMIRRPYGGKRSPVIVCVNWREALVAVAAHEARHIQQFQRNKPRSEVDAERFAAKALERYRESFAT